MTSLEAPTNDNTPSSWDTNLQIKIKTSFKWTNAFRNPDEIWAEKPSNGLTQRFLSGELNNSNNLTTSQFGSPGKFLISGNPMARHDIFRKN